MKKTTKKKSSKVSNKRSSASAPDEPELPSLVTAMTKLVERLGALEQKMDQVLGRLANLPSQIKEVARPHQQQTPQAPYVPQQSQRPVQHSTPAPRHEQGQGPLGNRRERPLFQVVCADCKKNCEIPFKPSEDRPVYCKECFSLRKANRAPQNVGRSSAVTHLSKKAGFVPSAAHFRSQGAAPVFGNAAILKTEKPKQAAAQSSNAKPKKKKR